MNLAKQIKAYLMLLIMLAMVVHSAFPHLHHVHSELDNQSVDVAHHHHHDGDHHHHEHDSNKGNDQHDERSLFSLLFAGHAHTNHTHYVIPALRPVASKTTKVISIAFIAQKPSYLPFDFTLNSPRTYRADKNRIDNGYLRSHFLRGPPLLG